jgi:putative alpha-1,2-mannosidase
VPRFTFKQPNGKSFVIVGEQAGPANVFVQSATLNGKPLNEPRIHHADIVAGGELRFVMGPRPSAWGTGGEFDAAQADRDIAPR